MNVLLLGGTGCEGHTIASACQSAGHDVTICSRGKKTTSADDIPTGIPVRTRRQARRCRHGPMLRSTGRTLIQRIPVRPSPTRLRSTVLLFGWLPVARIDALSEPGAYPTVRSDMWSLDITGTLYGAGRVGGLLLTTDGTDHQIPIYDASINH